MLWVRNLSSTDHQVMKNSVYCCIALAAVHLAVIHFYPWSQCPLLMPVLEDSQQPLLMVLEEGSVFSLKVAVFLDKVVVSPAKVVVIQASRVVHPHADTGAGIHKTSITVVKDKINKLVVAAKKNKVSALPSVHLAHLPEFMDHPVNASAMITIVLAVISVASIPVYSMILANPHRDMVDNALKMRAPKL